MSNLRNGLCHVDSILSIGSMSHVELRKQPCRPVEFKGQGPSETLQLGLRAGLLITSSHMGPTPTLETLLPTLTSVNTARTQHHLYYTPTRLYHNPTHLQVDFIYRDGWYARAGYYALHDWEFVIVLVN